MDGQGGIAPTTDQMERGEGELAHPDGEGDAARHPPQYYSLILVAILFLCGSLAMWWRVWAGHPSSTTLCGCGDPGLFTWFFKWAAFAIAHGKNPFYTNQILYPSGVNVLANTSELALGTMLAPVTWIFGPVASLNVALTLAPALSAFSAYWVMVQFVRFKPGAFVGAFLYGFSPFIVGNLSLAHLQQSFLPLPPLILLCLLRVLVDSNRSSMRTGAVLGVLVTVQYFIGSEVLLELAILGMLGTVYLVGYAAVLHRQAIARRARDALAGLATAAGVALVFLAYPLWFNLAGPRHLSGAIWPTAGIDGVQVSRFVSAPVTPAGGIVQYAGYFGQIESGAYLGIGLVAVSIGSIVVLRRRPLVQLLAAMAVTCAVLSLGAAWLPINSGPALPWKLFIEVPILENILPSNFTAMIYFFLGSLVALGIERAWNLKDGARSSERVLAPLLCALAATAVAVVAVAPIVKDYSIPYYRLHASALPDWFRIDAPRLHPEAVVLVYPSPIASSEVQVWQARSGMNYHIVNGDALTPDANSLNRLPGRDSAEGLLSVASTRFAVPPIRSDADLLVLRTALAAWHVSTIVVTSSGGSPAYAVAMFTAVLGVAPTRSHDAWVWQPVRFDRPPGLAAVDSLVRCASLGAGDPEGAAARCVLASSGNGSPG